MQIVDYVLKIKHVCFLQHRNVWQSLKYMEKDFHNTKILQAEGAKKPPISYTTTDHFSHDVFSFHKISTFPRKTKIPDTDLEKWGTHDINPFIIKQVLAAWMYHTTNIRENLRYCHKTVLIEGPQSGTTCKCFLAPRRSWV